jgi:hypothetical protein
MLRQNLAPRESIRYKQALAKFSPRLVVSEAGLALIYQSFTPPSATQDSMVLKLFGNLVHFGAEGAIC